MPYRTQLTWGGQVAVGTFALFAVGVGPPVGWVWVPSSGNDEYWVFDDLVYPAVQPGLPNPNQPITFTLLLDVNGDPLQHEQAGAPSLPKFKEFVKAAHPDPDVLTFERHTIHIV